MDYSILDLETWGRQVKWSRTNEILYSEIYSVKLLRATWSRSDERIFILAGDSIILQQCDLDYVRCFPGIEHVIGNKLHVDDRILKEVLDIEGTLLFPFGSRGNQSFAYGHFFTEVIRDLKLLSLYRLCDFKSNRMLLYPVDNWAEYLLRYYRINKDSYAELPKSYFGPKIPIYSTYNIHCRFYRYSDPPNTENILYSPLLFKRAKHDITRIVFLTRSEIQNRPSRWINLTEGICSVTETGMITTAMIDTTNYNIKSMISSMLDHGCPLIYVVAPGSGAYNPLLLTNSLVIMPTASYFGESMASWSGHLQDFVPFAKRLILLEGDPKENIPSHELRKHSAWDMPFVLNQYALTEICLRLVSYFIHATHIYDELDRTSERKLIRVMGTKANIPMSLSAIFE